MAALTGWTGPLDLRPFRLALRHRLDVDLTALPRPNGTHSVVAGETWNFQCWFRDKVGGMTTSNFTDGIEILFQ